MTEPPRSSRIDHVASGSRLTHVIASYVSAKKASWMRRQRPGPHPSYPDQHVAKGLKLAATKSDWNRFRYASSRHETSTRWALSNDRQSEAAGQPLVSVLAELLGQA
uniref:Uncharacterized protein n=1 Tax=Fusarium oxysporum (strain Fo5176) TaxID=660025 RepID=A0A0D2YCY1_FUSOF